MNKTPQLIYTLTNLFTAASESIGAISIIASIH
ncbi:CDP-diacylglycerol--serine O-phosphatidyltransferase, partial [Campylobacter jejuni]